MDRPSALPERPTPPPEPPESQPPSLATTPASGGDMAPASGMPGQREGRPTTISEAALQLTLKWMDHSSDAAELALGDAELAEAQAQSVVIFFSNVFIALQPHFPVAGAAAEDRRER